MAKRDIESKQSVLAKNWDDLLSGKYDRKTTQRNWLSLTPQEDTDEEQKEFIYLFETNLSFLVEQFNKHDNIIYSKIIFHYTSNYNVSLESFEKILLTSENDAIFINLFHNPALPIGLLLSDKLTRHIESFSQDTFLNYIRKRVIKTRWDEVFTYRDELLQKAVIKDIGNLPTEWVDKIIGWDRELFDE
jgi:hypothetical protein